MEVVRATARACAGLALVGLLGGCLTGLQQPLEYIAGGTGDQALLGDQASVQVYSPQSDLAISGGTPVEVNWRAVATKAFATVDVIVDPDKDADNGNELVAIGGLPVAETTALLDTTRLLAGVYFVGVRVVEVGEVVAAGYAPGRLTVNQRPNFYFTSPRDNFILDRSSRINPTFNVAWSVSDPDSTVSVQIFLDSDDAANGNEILLRTSSSQTGDSFNFDLPTASFEPGVYRLLALVSDGVDSFPFYAPGTIRLRARFAGFVDLRDMHLPQAGISGAVFEGFNPRDNAGSFVTSLGDVDNDGFNDFFILAQFGKPFYQSNIERTGVGEAYIIYGRPDRFSGMINLNSTGTLFRGEIYGGVPEQADPIRPSRGITSFTVLSDWDADGVREFAFGVPFTDSLAVTFLSGGINIAPLDADGYFRTGAVVIVAGSSLRPDLGFPGRNVFSLAQFGTLAHLPLKALQAGQCEEGFIGPKSPASPGQATWFHEHLVDSGGVANDGAIRLGARFSSSGFGDQFGETVTSWDFDAIVMAAPNRDPAVSVLGAGSVPGGGVISVFFVDVKDGFYPWTNGQSPPASGDYPGSAQSAGDRLLPHGGPYHYLIDDLSWEPGYVVDLDDNVVPNCNPSTDFHMSTPENSLRLWSEQPGARLSNVRGTSDVNADGLLDLVIGAPFTDEGAGGCFIVLGRVRDIIRGADLKLEELALPMNAPNPPGQRIFDGIRIVGSPGERLGQAQDSAGDFDNDGFADVVIGSPLLNNRQGGAAVFFGTRDAINLTQEDIPFAELPARNLGVIFVGEQEDDLAGARVAGVGDIDGDGNDDILIAAPNRSVRMDTNLDGIIDIDRTNCGVVYLIYGSPDLRGKTLSVSLVGTEQLPGAIFIGRNSADFLGAGLGEQGDRSFGIAGAGDVDGDGFRDILLGSVAASPRDRARAGEAYLLYGRGE